MSDTPSGEAGAGYREVTISAVVLGVLTGALMTAAFVYIGLKLGFGLAGSTVAAILGFALLRGVGRGVFGIRGAGSIVENNINQTIASGINTASAGVVFTFPALLLLGEEVVGEFELWPILVAAIAGSFMGIVIIIPLRKQMIEIERLRFPTGIAVGTILRSPGAGPKKAMYLGVGFVFALALTLLIKFGALPGTLPIGGWIQSALGIGNHGAGALLLMGTAVSLSMANVGAGLLSGRGGLPFALGGILAWWIIGPTVVQAGWAPNVGGDDLVGAVYGTMLRPTGIGILIGGALAGVIAAFPAIRGAFRSLSAASKLARQSGGAAEELPPRVLVIGLALAFFALLAVATTDARTDTGAIDWGVALLVAVAGTLWLGLAGLIVAQATGATDISPLSGLALIAVTLMLGLSGGNVLLAVTIGVAVCIATNQCADMMSDLKTGHLVGSIPRRQQLVQFGVAWIGPAIAIGTTLLLWAGGPGGTDGFGPESWACQNEQPDCLPAPQAGVLQGMIQSVLGGDAPLDKYLAGTVIGGGLALFPIGGLGVLIGLAMYLPFEITLGYGVGCGLHILLDKLKGKRFVGDVIVPLAAGLIVGEALTSLTLTLITLVTGAGGGGGGH
ncbi:MAG TPA: OPT/YSL family transporter [Sandaracinaceae bacterium LLY-WYZ-13_1]|nr:OPT/YSL family transporter [Sandaracinaceae bacterium LLY-WYZ-13_1]